MTAKKDTTATQPQQEPVQPQYVRAGFMLANFVKPHFLSDKEEKFIELEFSIELTAEHKGWVPEPIQHAWNFVGEEASKSVAGIEVKRCAAVIRLVPDSNEGELELKFADIVKNAVTVVEEKGTGEAMRIVRWSFRIDADHAKDIIKFATSNYAGPVWLKLEPIQREMDLKK